MILLPLILLLQACPQAQQAQAAAERIEKKLDERIRLRQREQTRRVAAQSPSPRDSKPAAKRAVGKKGK